MSVSYLGEVDGACESDGDAAAGVRAKQGSPVRQAVVLAGGLGRRMLPLSRFRPKAMVEVDGTPILRHQIDWFAGCGVRHVVVSAGHLAQVIVDYLGSARVPLRVQVVVEERPLGRGGALKRAAGELPYPNEPWLAAYGDIWTGFALADMAAYHRRHGAPATVALAGPGLPGQGMECDERGLVTALVPDPAPRCRVNAGVYLFAPQVVGLLPDTGDHVPGTLARLAGAGQLMGYPVEGMWRAVNTPHDLAGLEGELAAARRSAGTS
ncbi:nucleotidyltransferase family protein [Embleya sp. AB8]|uniref:nucleotidyltransferase family protein n=1 Tax=Embleya sp. AB8 TaxID=3156304 RepID=UPI003C774164